jgi:hypothetical protein
MRVRRQKWKKIRNCTVATLRVKNGITTERQKRAVFLITTEAAESR